MPFLVEIFGTDEELDFEVSVKRPRVTFGPLTGENVAFSCEIRFGIKQQGSMNYIFYDQMQLDTKFNMEISEETVLANFFDFELTKAGTDKDRKKPVF